ncbi:MAG: hypothetical protein A2020_00945 [Lentisphaerae bacterium GWF2_45_14]|nr:MAG: hypothetical protein A2020_00945 [Lentisphaerae bacterium GWF2_45_14]
MKTATLTASLVAAFMVLAWTSISADEANFSFNERVGNGWHMETIAYIDSDGVVKGRTSLKNYNNIRGFTGGLFIVALDENDNAIYASNLHKWGANASFFKKCKTRTESWEEQIPSEYLPKMAKFTVVQMHTPTNRVWTWIYENKQIIIDHAKYVADLYKKYKNNELGSDDLLAVITTHIN